MAQVARPTPRPDEAFDFMNLLSSLGLHNYVDETWNAYGQPVHQTSDPMQLEMTVKSRRFVLHVGNRCRCRDLPR